MLKTNRFRFLLVSVVLLIGVLVVKDAPMLRTYLSNSQSTVGSFDTEIKPPQVLQQLPDYSEISAQLLRSNQAVTPKLKLIVVNTPRSIQQGLSGQPVMPANGMLFLLPESRIPSFWMIDMQFDLDMIWLHDGIVVDVTERVPAPEPGAADRDLPTFSPSELTNQVLEVPAGFVQQHGISIGDQLELIAE